jgi:hypothetical protein
MASDPVLPRVFTRSMAADAGLHRNQVTRRVANGRLLRLTRGAFCLPSSWERASPEQRHLLLARAVALTREETPPAAFSHVTAAVLHNLPAPASALGSVWMTAATGFSRSTRYGPLLRREVATLDHRQLTELHGLGVTTLARTVADCLRHLPPEDAVPIADAALHGSELTVDRLRAVVAEQANWPYAARAAAAMRLVDGRRETAIESRSAVVFDRFSLPAPVPQLRIVDAAGRFVARPDFAWLAHGVVGEADGAVKYVGDDVVGVIRAEKDRQAALEALGLLVVRWDWRHLFGSPPEAVLRVRRALEAGDPRRFRGAVA